jgi:uncharacterized membrane protein YfcA
MKSKHLLSFVGGIASFVVVALALRKLLPEEYALGMGWLVMLIVGIPFTRSFSRHHHTFMKWVVLCTAAALAGALVLVAFKGV